MRVGDGTPGPGRPKGLPNKRTKEAKEAIAQAFEENGGIGRLVAWIKEDPKNETLFLTTIWPKLIPLQVHGTHHVETVDRTELLQRARDEVRTVFGDRALIGGPADGGGLPH